MQSVNNTPELYSEGVADKLLPTTVPPTPSVQKLRKQYVTIQHPVATSCGHKLDIGRQPRKRNCENCWFNFFNENGTATQTIEQAYQEHGKDFIIQLQGYKFYDMWRKFLSTLAEWKRLEENEKQGSRLS
jgi:hypothetical protein